MAVMLIYLVTERIDLLSILLQDGSSLRSSLESNIVVMGFTSMVANFGNTLWFYFLPIYYYEVFGATPVEITLIFAVWYAIAALGSAPAGALADVIGRKKVVVLSSLISSSGIFILAYSNSFIISAAALPLCGLGTAFFTVSNTLVAESVEASKRGAAFGKYQALGGTAAAISPIIGGITIAGIGYFPLFMIGAFFTLFAALARAFLLTETLRVVSKAKIEIKWKNFTTFGTKLRYAFSDRTFFALVLIYSLYNMLVEQNSPITSLYARTVLGFDPTNLGILFSGVVLITAISRFGFGKMADRIGFKKTVLISFIGEMSVVYVFVFSPKDLPEVAIIGMAFWMLFGVMDAPAINAWIAHLSPDDKTRGFAMGVFYSATSVSTVPALILSGFLFSIEPQFPFYANTLLGIVALVLLIRVPKQRAIKPAESVQG